MSGSRGKVELGQLMLFVMMVIVAAVSTGILINSVGILETSKDTQSVPENTQIQIIEKTGAVAGTNSGAVQTVELTVGLEGNAETFSFSDMTVEWFGPTGHTTLQYSAKTETNHMTKPATEFAVERVQEANGNHPQQDPGRTQFTIKVDAAAINNGQGLPAGTTVAVKITTPSGAVHFLTLEVPDAFTSSTVNL